VRRTRLRPAVFLDKDGTLVENVPFNADPSLVVLAPGAGEALRLLKRAGFALIVVSNQPGVGLGRFPAAALDGVTRRLNELLEPDEAAPDAVYYCPHAPLEAGAGRLPCTCRKPAPGLLFRAAREHGLHLPSSWMVGDILDDVEAGRAAGCRTILLDNGGETEWRRSALRSPHHVARSLIEAARIIVAGAGAAARSARAGTLVAPRHLGGSG
jgi:histidinol-phosphate phosphatase family protein